MCHLMLHLICPFHFCREYCTKLPLLTPDHLTLDVTLDVTLDDVTIDVTLDVRLDLRLDVPLDVAPDLSFSIFSRVLHPFATF